MGHVDDSGDLWSVTSRSVLGSVLGMSGVGEGGT